MPSSELRKQRNTKRLLQVLLELSLVSHVKGTSYDTSMSGGKAESILPGGGVDRRGDSQPEYRQKSAYVFVRRLEGILRGLDREKLSLVRAEALRDEVLLQAVQALRDWRRTPATQGHEPEKFTRSWKILVANDKRSPGVVASFYGISRVSVVRYRQQYAGVEE